MNGNIEFTFTAEFLNHLARCVGYAFAKGYGQFSTEVTIPGIGTTIVRIVTVPDELGPKPEAGKPNLKLVKCEGFEKKP